MSKIENKKTDVGFMKKNGKKGIAIVVVVIVLIIGIHAIKKAKKKDESTPVATSYALVVSTQKVVKNKVSLTLPYLALVKNDKDVLLASKIAGRVLYVKKSGSKVKVGDIVARLDNTSILSNINSVNAQLESVDVALENMTATHNRTEELLKVEGASVEQSQKEESAIAQLESKKETLTQKLSELKNMLSYATITSPVSGNISKTMLNVGDMAMPGHPIAKLQAKKGFYLLVRVPTNFTISAVIANEKRWSAIPLNSAYHGLAEYKVYANIPHLMSGDRLEVAVEIYNGEGIMLPFDALLNRNGKSFVLLKENTHAVAKEVTVIASGEEGIVVGNKELEGAEIIVEKQDILLKLLTGISLKVKGE